MAIQNGQTADADDINAELSALAADISALDSVAVKLSGNQTVQGVKTFGSIPVLPASDPTTDNQAARKAYVDAKVDVAAGDTLIVSADTQRDHSGFGTWSKEKEILITKKGTYRVKFELKGQNDQPDMKGRIYKNGASYGTERAPASTDWQLYSEDLSFDVGDLVQLYLYSVNSWAIYCINFRLYVATKEVPIVNLN